MGHEDCEGFCFADLIEFLASEEGSLKRCEVVLAGRGGDILRSDDWGVDYVHDAITEFEVLRHM